MLPSPSRTGCLREYCTGRHRHCSQYQHAAPCRGALTCPTPRGDERGRKIQGGFKFIFLSNLHFTSLSRCLLSSFSTYCLFLCFKLPYLLFFRTLFSFPSLSLSPLPCTLNLNFNLLLNLFCKSFFLISHVCLSIQHPVFGYCPLYPCLFLFSVHPSELISKSLSCSHYFLQFFQSFALFSFNLHIPPPAALVALSSYPLSTLYNPTFNSLSLTVFVAPPPPTSVQRSAMCSVNIRLGRMCPPPLIPGTATACQQNLSEIKS